MKRITKRCLGIIPTTYHPLQNKVQHRRCLGVAGVLASGYICTGRLDALGRDFGLRGPLSTAPAEYHGTPLGSIVAHCTNDRVYQGPCTTGH